jgi:hypothetical protein
VLPDQFGVLDATISKRRIDPLSIKSTNSFFDASGRECHDLGAFSFL